MRLDFLNKELTGKWATAAIIGQALVILVAAVAAYDVMGSAFLIFAVIVLVTTIGVVIYRHRKDAKQT